MDDIRSLLRARSKLRLLVEQGRNHPCFYCLQLDRSGSCPFNESLKKEPRFAVVMNDSQVAIYLILSSNLLYPQKTVNIDTSVVRNMFELYPVLS